MLSIRLEESDCFSAWIMGTDTRLDASVSDLKCESGIGYLLRLVMEESLKIIIVINITF